MTDRFYYLLTKGMLKHPPIKPPDPTNIPRTFELNMLNDTDSVVGTTASVSFDAIVDVIVPANSGQGIELQADATISNISAGTTISKIRWSYNGVTLHDEPITPFTYEFNGDYVITSYKVPLSNADDGLLYAMTYGMLLENTDFPNTFDDNTYDKRIEILNSSNVVVGTMASNVAVTFPPDGKGLWLDVAVRVEGFTSGDEAVKARLSTSQGTLQVANLAVSKTYSNIGTYTLENFPIEL